MSSARRALVSAVVVAAGVFGPVAAAQASPNKPAPAPTTTNMSQTSETAWNNPNAPSWCKAEDDYDYRTFTGSLNGSISTSYQLCDRSVDYYNGIYWDAGGEGLEADVAVVGQLSSLTITAPDGTTHAAVLMGQSTTKGVTTYDYAACYVPAYYRSSDIGTNALPGGVWQIAMSGQVSKATLTTRDDMTDVTFQQNYCPSSEQNII